MQEEVQLKNLISNLFIILAQGENEVEEMRRELNKCDDFDPYLFFNRLDQYRRNYLTEDNLLTFANLNNIKATNNQGKLLILFYDTNNKHQINYNEFLNMILCKEYYDMIQERKSVNNENDYYISYDTEKKFCVLLQKEFELCEQVLKIVIEIKYNSDFSLVELVKSFNCKNNNDIPFKNIINFINQNSNGFHNNLNQLLFKRLDIKKNGKISLSNLEKIFHFPSSVKKNNNKQLFMNNSDNPQKNYINNNSNLNDIDDMKFSKKYNFSYKKNNSNINNSNFNNNNYNNNLPNSRYSSNKYYNPLSNSKMSNNNQMTGTFDNRSTNYMTQYPINNNNSMKINNRNRNLSMDFKNPSPINYNYNNDNNNNNNRYISNYNNNNNNKSSLPNYSSSIKNSNINNNNNSNYSNYYPLKNNPSSSSNPTYSLTVKNITSTPQNYSNTVNNSNLYNNNSNNMSNETRSSGTQYTPKFFKKQRIPQLKNDEYHIDKAPKGLGLGSSQESNYKVFNTQSVSSTNSNNHRKIQSINPGKNDQESPYKISDTLGLRLSPVRKYSNKLENDYNNYLENKQIAMKNPIPNFTEGDFIAFLQLLMDNEREIENKKIQLLYNQPDFNIEKAYEIFETSYSKDNILRYDDLKNGLNKLKIDLDENDYNLKLLINRYDLSGKTNGISFCDFFDMFVPFNKEKRDNVENRNNTNLTDNTIDNICNFINIIINSEKCIEVYRDKLIHMNGFNLKQIFQIIDEYNFGFISDQLLELYLKKSNTNFNQNKSDLLFIRLDKDRDGKIYYSDLVNEVTPMDSDIIIN